MRAPRLPYLANPDQLRGAAVVASKIGAIMAAVRTLKIEKLRLGWVM